MTQTLPDKIQNDMLSRSFVVQFDAATPAADRHPPNNSFTHSSVLLDGATGKTGEKRGHYPPPGELTRAIPASSSSMFHLEWSLVLDPIGLCFCSYKVASFCLYTNS